MISDPIRMIVVILVSVSFSQNCVAQQAGKFGDDCTSSGCHGKLVASRFVHAPARANQCDACHQPLGGKSHRFELTSDPGELCMDCHDDLVEDLEFHHGPVAVGSCTSCHNPHASDHDKLLIETGPKLCAQCHEDVFENIEDMKSVHQPVRGDCLGCHRAHGADNKMLLTSTPPNLCFDCHDDVADAVEDATVSHAPVAHGRACLNCHNPHASDAANLLLDDGARLCLTCHDKSIDSGRGVIANIADRLAGHQNPHGPVGKNDCVSCHQPHGGERARFLTGTYPMKRYVAFDEEAYTLCFGCHEVEAFDDADTDEATGFRDGRRNLHFLHVSSESKGRTCRFCHDAHAGNNAHQVTDSVAFGEWRIPINYKATETGGSCAPGCHQPRRYDRETPVDPNRKIPPKLPKP